MMSEQKTCFTISRPIAVELPSAPERLRVANGNGKSIAVGDLTNDELSGVAAEWKEALFANAERQRNAPKELPVED